MIFMCSGTTAEKEIVLEYRDLTGGKDETDADTRPTTTVIQLQNTIILKLNYRTAAPRRRDTQKGRYNTGSIHIKHPRLRIESTLYYALPGGCVMNFYMKYSIYKKVFTNAKNHRILMLHKKSSIHTFL